MQSFGFPVVRIESQEKSACYFCHNPKRPNKNWTFNITREKRGGHCFFTCGLSQLSKRIVSRLSLEGVFNKGYSNQSARDGQRGRQLGNPSLKTDRS